MFSRNIEFRKVSRTIIASLICANMWGVVYNLNEDVQGNIATIETSLTKLANSNTGDIQAIIKGAKEYIFGEDNTNFADVQKNITIDGVTVTFESTDATSDTQSSPVSDFFSKLFFGVSAKQLAETNGFSNFLLFCVFPLWIVKSIFQFINNLFRFDFGSCEATRPSGTQTRTVSEQTIKEKLQLNVPAVYSEKLSSIWESVKRIGKYDNVSEKYSDPKEFVEELKIELKSTKEALAQINKLVINFGTTDDEKRQSALQIAALLMLYPHCRVADIVDKL